MPTTGEVRDGYVKQMMHWTLPQQENKWKAEFDRWLESVKAEAWDEGKRAEETAWMHTFNGHPVEEGDVCDQCPTDNPYRKETL